MNAVLKAMRQNRRDAEGIARLRRMGRFRPVHCKSVSALEAGDSSLGHPGCPVAAARQAVDLGPRAARACPARRGLPPEDDDAGRRRRYLADGALRDRRSGAVPLVAGCGPWVRPTPRLEQSNGRDIVGRITKAEDARLRAALFNAACRGTGDRRCASSHVAGRHRVPPTARSGHRRRLRRQMRRARRKPNPGRANPAMTKSLNGTRSRRCRISRCRSTSV